MPGWRVHAFVDRTLFGKSYCKIHRRLDEPFKYLGRGHRILFHDFPTAYLVAHECYPGDPNEKLAAAAEHILLDEQCSADPEYKKLLEKLAVLSRKKKKGQKVPKIALTHVEQLFLSDMKKVAEIRRLRELLRS